MDFSLTEEQQSFRDIVRRWVNAEALAVQSGLVWAAITAHGWAEDRVGFGDDCAAAGGLASWVDGEQRLVGDALADPLTGLEGALACRAERDDSGNLTGRFWREDNWLGERLPRVLPDLADFGRELAAMGLTGLTDAGAATAMSRPSPRTNDASSIARIPCWPPDYRSPPDWMRLTPAWTRGPRCAPRAIATLREATARRGRTHLGGAGAAPLSG